jgi:hypothetical protein
MENSRLLDVLPETPLDLRSRGVSGQHVSYNREFSILSLYNNGCFFKFGVEVGVELSIVNALYRLRITDQLFECYAFTRVVRSQSTLQRLLRRQI